MADLRPNDPVPRGGCGGVARAGSAWCRCATKRAAERTVAGHANDGRHARALRPDPDSELAALILDEPTARLSAYDIVELARCVRDLATQGSAVLIVSHHLEEVLELADVVTVLRDGVRVLTAPASTLTRRALVGAMTGEDAAPTAPRSIMRSETLARDADVVLSCRGLAGVSFEDVSVDIRGGEVVGIAGLEGSGRDELLPVIFGASERLDGTVHVGGQPLPPGDVRSAMSAGVAYLPADRGRSAVVPELSARENLTLADVRSISRPALVDRARERQEARRWFARFDVRPSNAIDQPLATFSGGNQQKIVLARWLRRAPRVLLLDEPTYGVDAAAEASLHASLLEAAAQGAAIVISSSDEQELATVCDQVIVLRRGTVATELTSECLSARSIAAAVITTDDDAAEVGGAA